jgi:glutaredoxin 3
MDTTQQPVIIYSTAVCHFCALAKEYFKAHNIAYTEYNVGADVEKRKEMVELTGQLGVPVIRIGDQVVVGFREDVIAHMLDDNNTMPMAAAA